MPVVLREGPYRVIIYVHDPGEPPHVHVRRDRFEAKFWLCPLALARAGGLAPIELQRIRRILAANVSKLIEEWHARHG